MSKKWLLNWVAEKLLSILKDVDLTYELVEKELNNFNFEETELIEQIFIKLNKVRRELYNSHEEAYKLYSKAIGEE